MALRGGGAIRLLAQRTPTCRTTSSFLALTLMRYTSRMTSAIKCSRRAPMRRAPAGVPRGRASSDDDCGASWLAASYRNTVRRDTPSPAGARVTLSARSLVSTSAAMTASRRLASSHWASVACTRDASDVTVRSDDVGGTGSSEAEIVDSPPLARSRTTTPPSLPTRTTATNRSAATATAPGSAWKWPICAAPTLLRRWCQIERVKSKVVPNERSKPARSSSVPSSIM